MSAKFRALLVNMASHMAYMQDQLQAWYEFDDWEDYHWYRESEALRAKVEAALAEPEPEGPTDKELAELYRKSYYECENRQGDVAQVFALRAVLARWGNHRGILSSSPQSPSGEVAEHARWLNFEAEQALKAGRYFPAEMLTRAAELLSRLSPPQPIPVSERLPEPEDCDAEKRCWAGIRESVDTSGDRDIDLPPSWELREVCAQDDVWLPANALPQPNGEVE